MSDKLSDQEITEFVDYVLDGAVDGCPSAVTEEDFDRLQFAIEQAIWEVLGEYVKEDDE